MYEVDRTRRVAALIKRELATLIARELNDNRINSVSVTGVTVTKDLRESTIFVSAIDNSLEPAKIEKLLNNSSRFLRYLLSQRIDLRITPNIQFKYDDSIERGVYMSKLIDSLKKTNDGQETD